MGSSSQCCTGHFQRSLARGLELLKLESVGGCPLRILFSSLEEVGQHAGMRTIFHPCSQYFTRAGGKMLLLLFKPCSFSFLSGGVHERAFSLSHLAEPQDAFAHLRSSLYSGLQPSFFLYRREPRASSEK